LYEYTIAVKTGIVPDTLKDQKPGPLNHARWLTLALRILIFYTRSENPSPSLLEIVKFVVQVYVVMWFEIVKKPAFTMGSRHLFLTMRLIKTQSEEVQIIAKRVLQHNAYFAHPENILCTMLEDDEISVRKKAVEKILKCREKRHKPKSKVARGIRLFRPPKLNWNATRYDEIIDLNSHRTTTS